MARLSDALKERRAQALDRMSALSDAAGTDNRLFTDDESREFDKLQVEVRSLDSQIERQLAAEDLRRKGSGTRRAVDDHGREHLILSRAHKFADRHPPRDGQPLDIAKAIRGITTGRWDDADYERRAMGESSLPGGGYAVPAELSAQWIDMARSRSVTISAGAGTLPMSSMSLRIAEIVGDVAPAFRPENVALPESDLTFGALDLKARLVGVVCRASLELISDSPMASDMITASITGALGVAMDAAMLAGDGVRDATHDNCMGILAWPGVNAIPVGAAPADFDHWLDAINLIEVANLEPNAVVDHPNTANQLRKIVTGIAGDLTKLRAPDAYTALSPYVTTGLPAGNSIVGQFDCALFGMREGVVIEATRVGDTALKNAQVLIRGYMRLDTGLTRAKAFTKLTGIA